MPLDGDSISDLDARAARAIARAFRKAILTLEGHADRLDQDDVARDRRRAQRSRRAAAWQAVEHRRQATGDLDQAIEDVARDLDMTPDQVRAVWSALDRVNSKRRRQARDVEIMQRARQGLTDAAIADDLVRLGYRRLHPKTIGRLIRKRVAAVKPLPIARPIEAPADADAPLDVSTPARKTRSAGSR